MTRNENRTTDKSDESFKDIDKRSLPESKECNTFALGECSHAEGCSTKAIGDCSHAEGCCTKAAGTCSHAEGCCTKAKGDCSHSEGKGIEIGGLLTSTSSKGKGTHAEGGATKAVGDYSHAEGSYTTSAGVSSHAEGSSTFADGFASHAEGSNTEASGETSHAEGVQTIASGEVSHAEGRNTEASGELSHAEGEQTRATGRRSHAEGFSTEASGFVSHAEGSFSVASGFQAHAQNFDTIASGNQSHAEGVQTIAAHTGSHIMGREGTTCEAFAWHMANNNTITARIRNNGTACFSGTEVGTAGGVCCPDVAEMFETNDGQTIDVGYFVTLDGNDKIRKATAEDKFILGVTSSTPGIVLGTVSSEKYLTDEWGRVQFQDVTVPERRDEKSTLLMPEYTVSVPMANPEYKCKDDCSRNNKPEWVAVGLLGQIRIRDDGTCKVGRYCKPNKEGIATLADEGFIVMKRTGSNQVVIFFFPTTSLK